MQDLMDLARQTLSWRGRANRRTFCLSVALLLLLGFLTLPLEFAGYIFSNLRWASLAIAALGLGLGFGSAVFLLGALIRRLHDRGKSGWWLLLFFGPHVVLTTILSRMGDANVQMMLLAGGLLLDMPFIAWGMVEILLLPSAQGPNAHGPAPADLALASARS
jgi:uncharacterized membrane protein YhaH (DUF805 family)